jgi:hypothetical protein
MRHIAAFPRRARDRETGHAAVPHLTFPTDPTRAVA